MARKVQLTLSYVDRFIGHYRRVRTILYDDLSGLALNKESRVAIVGTDELAELAYLALRDIGVDDIEVFSREPERPTFLGIPVRELGSMNAESYASVVLAVSGTDAVEDYRGRLLGSGLPSSRLVELMRPRNGGRADGGPSEDR